MKNNRWSICLVLFLFSLGISAFAQTDGTTNLPIISIQATDNVATEPGDDTGRFIVYRYGNTNSDLTVAYSVGGTASNGVDYALLPGTVTFPAGATNVLIVLHPVDDTLAEPTESVVLTLKASNSSNYQVSSVSNAVVYIYDNDDQAPTVTMLSPTNGASFSGPTNILLQAQAQDTDGTIGHVGFYNGTVLLGNVATATNGVYSLLSSFTNFGSFTLTARAYDNFEIAATSAPVVVFIAEDSNQSPMVSLRVTDSSASRPTGDTAAFSVTRFGSTNSDLTVYYSIGGTASNGIDYVTLPNNVVLHAGTTNATVLIHPIEGLVAKPQESVVLTLIPVPGTDGSDYQISTAKTGTVYIQDTNRPPIATLLSPTNGASFTAPANITLQAQASDSDGTIRTVYFYNNNSVVGAVTNGSSNVYTFVLSNVAVGNYSLMAQAIDNLQGLGRTESVNISVVASSNQPPLVSIQTIDATASEPGTDTGTFMVSRHTAPDSALTVYYSVKGTASNGIDYVSLPGNVTIPAGASNGFITIQPIDDNIPETTENVTLTLIGSPLASPQTYQIGSPSNATASIYDNDVNHPPIVTMLSPTNGASFTNPATVLLRAQADDGDGSISAVIFYNGTTAIGLVTAPTTASNWYSMSWSNVPVGNYTLTAQAVDNLGSNSTSAPVNISITASSNMPLVSIQAIDAIASESGNDTGTFMISRNVGINSDLTVYYSVKGTASNGVDYVTLLDLVTIPAGASNAFITVRPIDDSIPEATETVTLSLIPNPLSSPQMYQIGSPSNATVSIYDNDVNYPPTVTMLSPTNGASFTNPATVLLRAQAEDADGSISLVSFYNGTNLLGQVTAATSASNWYSMSWSNVAAGNYTLIARAVDNLGSSSTSAPVVITVTAASNQVPVVSLTVIDSSAGEPTNTGAFSVVRSGNTNSDLIVYYSITGSASNGVDYVALPGYVTVPAGKTNATILIQPIDDNIYEATETVTLTLTQSHEVSPYQIGTAKSGTVSILDNETNQAPTIVLLSPTNGARFTAPASVLLQAQAHDPDGGIFYVSFYNGTNLIGEVVIPSAGSNLYNMTWKDVPPGTYTLTARAVDNFQKYGTSAPVNITVTSPTNLPPVVSLLSPINGAVFSPLTNVFIYASANDTDGVIKSVEIFANDQSLGFATNHTNSDTAAHIFSLTWTNPASGNYALTAKATDNEGAQTISAAVNIFVPVIDPVTNVPPTVRVSSPTNGTVLYAPVNTYIYASASDPDDTVSTVEFFANGVSLGIATNQPSIATLVNPFHVLWSNVPAGTYALTARATDSRGAAKTSEPVTVTVKVENIPPTIAITSPTNGSLFYGPTNISVTADASDADGTVKMVTFYSGNRLIAVCSNAPYSALWTNVSPGTYQVIARAGDDNGKAGYSSPVNITVRSVNELSFAKRTLPLWYVAGVKLLVYIQALPSSNTVSYSLTDTVPAGWVIGAAGTNATVAPSGQSVTFGPFNDHLARMFVYEVTPPANTTGEKHFSGSCSADGATGPILGMSSIVPVPPHPADHNPTNFVIGTDELNAYVAAWQQDSTWPISPSPVPISYVTRAGYLLQNGGNYGISTAYPTPFPPLLWVLTNKTVVPLSLSSPIPWTTNNYGSAIASMPTNYSIRIPMTVTIAVTPYPSVSAYALEDRPPEGWVVSSVSDGGVYSSVTKKVKWGLFTDSTPRTVSYQVTPMTNFVNVAEFAGVLSADGVNVPITGIRRTSLSNGILPPAKLQSITTLTNGDRIITFIGTPGVAYRLEGSTDLSTWTPMDQLLNNDGVLNYSDLGGSNFVNRFYRAVPIDGN